MTSLVTDMFKQTCRTCLSNDGEMVPIFSSDYYVNQIPKKLMAFIEVEISDNDGMPKMICKKCIFLADSFYCFKKQCEFADNQLKILIKKSLNRDNLSDGEKREDSNGTSNEIAATLVTNFKKTILDDKNLKNEAKNIVDKFQETEDNYTVEYISEEVRIDVENALKRRREVERRISIEKVSESIKNLKGIEVVPISDVNVTRNGGNSRTKKEEIVVFPVKVSKKRCKVIETIVIDDPSPVNKRLRLPLETTVSKINGADLKREDSIVYGKQKKLNFSTIRKVVKIDDEELCVEPKEEFIKESARENCQIKYDNDVVVLSDDSGEQKSQFQYSTIEIENNSEKQEPKLLEAKLQKKPKNDKEKRLKAQPFKFSDVIQNVVDYNEINKAQDIFSESNSADNEKECTFYPSIVEEHLQMFDNLELKEMRKPRLANDIQNQDVVEKSTIGCIINGIDEQNFDDINPGDDVEDVTSFESINDVRKSFVDCRTDKINEVFIENEVSNSGDDCSTAQKIGRKNSKLNSISFAGNRRQNCGDSSSLSDQVTPLALLSVNSSGEENRTLNLKIYKRNDSERIGGTKEDDSSVKHRTMTSSTHHNSRNSHLKFYQCTICSISFVSMPAVLKHNVEKHMADQVPVFCLICDKSFPDKASLCDHVEEHNGSKPYKCTFCPKTFTLKRNLKRHVNHHINYKPFQCRICMKRFSEKSSLKSHTYLHTGDSPFACKICGVSFNNKTNWRRHVMTIHEKITAVVCKYCNKELPNKRSLRVHVRVHTGDRPYQCPHCDKRFTQQCNLNTHIHCHLNDRPFGCPHCGKGFNQRGTRDDHILTHTGEKPHKCTECGAGFTVSSALKRHMWIHTDKDRPYNCEKCKLQFVGLYDLRRHLKIRHGKVVKLENPRVERVLRNDQNREADIFDVDGSEDTVQVSRSVGCSKAEITAKENSSLSCNVNKIEDVDMGEIKKGFSETKIENFNNEAKEESVNNSDTLVGGGAGNRISVTDISRR